MGFGGTFNWMTGKLKQSATQNAHLAFNAAVYWGAPTICRFAQDALHYVLRSHHGGMGSGQIEELQEMIEEFRDRIEELGENVKLQTTMNKFLVERIQLSESSIGTLFIGSNIKQKPEDAFLGSNMEQKSDVFVKPEDVSLGSNMEQKPKDVFVKPEDVFLGSNMSQKMNEKQKDENNLLSEQNKLLSELIERIEKLEKDNKLQGELIKRIEKLEEDNKSLSGQNKLLTEQIKQSSVLQNAIGHH